MNRLNRLFRGNENSSPNFRRNFNNGRSFSPNFENSNEVNINRRMSPFSDTSSRQTNYNYNIYSTINNNESVNYPSPLQQNNRNNSSETSSIHSVSLDPSGCINELCIANINNSCKFGNHCRFIHGKPCTICNKNVYNPLQDLSEQMIEHSKECRKSDINIEVKKDNPNNEDTDENFTCSICLENIIPPTEFGVLCNCNHYFCYECIKIWRNSQDFSDINNHLKCPLCKTKSQFLIPSKEFPRTKKERDMLILKYKQELANTECKKLRDTNYKYCPYGDNCIYSHYRPDGKYMHFNYMTDANQFVSPEEYNQNIYQNDTTGFIQYYNNRLIEEALLADDGDDFGMHNGVFTNPFYHSDDSLDNDIPYFNNLNQNTNIDLNPNYAYYSPNVQGTEIYDPSLGYMIDNVANNFSGLNIDNHFDENSDDGNDSISDINDSEISDYLDEIDEDLNLYYMMNNRNGGSSIVNSPNPSIISNANSNNINNERSPASVFSNMTYPSPRLPPPFRQRRINLTSRNLDNNSNNNNINNNNSNNNNNNNNNNDSNSNNHINENSNDNNNIDRNSIQNRNNNDNNVRSNNENNFNLSLNRSLNRNYRTLSRDYTEQATLSTLSRVLNEEANPNDSFNTFGIDNEDSRNISQYSSSHDSIRNTTITPLTELLSNETNNISGSNNILNNISILTNSTNHSNNIGNTSVSTDTITISNFLDNKSCNKENVNKDNIIDKRNNDFSIQSISKVANKYNSSSSSKMQEKKTINDQNLITVNQCQSSNLINKNNRSDSTSSMDTNFNNLQNLQNIPHISIDGSSSSSSQERLPHRFHTNRHIHGNNNTQEKNNNCRNRNESLSQVGSLSSSLSQNYPIYTSHKADIEIESNFSNSLTSSSSFIGEDEIYAKYYHNHESPNNDNYYIGNVGSNNLNHSGKRYSNLTKTSNNNSSNSQNLTNATSSYVTEIPRVVISGASNGNYNNSQSSSANRLNNQQYSTSFDSNASRDSVKKISGRVVHSRNNINNNNNNNNINNNNDNKGSIDMNRSNVVRLKEYKGPETDLILNNNKGLSFSIKNYNENEDIESDSSGEIEDVIVRSSSGYVNYAELSDSEFNEIYIETKI